MFWKAASRSHITRLTVITSLAVGLVLAIAFGAIYNLSQSFAMHETELELRNAASFLASDPSELSNMQEFHAEHPNKTATLFAKTGAVLTHGGNLELLPEQGFSNRGSILAVGVPYLDGTLVVGTSGIEIGRGLQRLALVLSAMWLPLVWLVGFVTYRTALAMFIPLNRLATQAAMMSGSDLKRRLDAQDRREFGRLADQLNAMLDRLEQAAKREEQFASDAAHELRTPLAILRTRIETTLLRERSADDYTQALDSLLIEVDRISATAESLLATTRAESTPAIPIEISQLIRESESGWRARFEEKGRMLSFRLSPARVAIHPEEVKVVLNNLLENAYRYANPSGQVSVELDVADGKAILEVADEGPGVSPEMEAKLFDRFARGEESRNATTGGVGIGLALVKRIVETRLGTICYRRTPKGSAFRCEWPLV